MMKVQPSPNRAARSRPVTSLLLVSIVLAVVCLIAPPAAAQDDDASSFTGIRELIRLQNLEAAETQLSARLAQEDLSVAERAEAMDLLVEVVLRAPYPDYEAAFTLARETVEYREAQMGPDDPRLALSYRQLGIVLEKLGDDEEALAYFQRAIEQTERLEGIQSAHLCAPLNSVGVSYMRAQNHAEAVEVFTRTLDIYDLAEDKSDLAPSIYLRNRAKCYRVLGDMAAAEADYRRAIALLEAQEAPNFDELVICLIDLANLLYDLNRGADALEPALGALAVAQDLYDANHPKLARTHQFLGLAYRRSARFDEARVQLERAVEIRELYAEEDPLELSSALGALANLETDLGNLEKAKALHRQSLELAELASGPSSDAVAINCTDLAIGLTKSGDYVEARYYFDRARNIDLALYGPDHPYVAGDHLNVGSVAFYAGDYEAAERDFLEAQRIYRAALPEGHPQIAVLDLNYATLLLRDGRLEESRARYESSLAVLAEALGPGSPDLAEGLDSYGKVLFELGEPELAREQLERSLQIRRAAFGETHPDVALSLGALANLDASLGDLDAALVLAEEALAITEIGRGPWHPWTGRALQDLATLRYLRGEYEPALELALTAEQVGRRHLRLLARGSSERQALAYSASRAQGIDLAVASAVQLGNEDVVAAVWNEVIRSRALVLDEMAFRHWNIALSTNEELRSAAEQLAEARERLAGLTVRGAGEMDEETYALLLAQASEQKESLELRLAALSPSLQTQRDAEQIGWAELSARLPQELALVSFIRYEPSEEAARYAVFVVDGNTSLPQLIDLGEAASVEAAVGAWRGRLQEGAIAEGPLAQAAETAYLQDAARLRELVWDPIAARVQGAALVCIVPDGVMHLVSFAALPGVDGHYLVENEQNLHVLSTERELYRYLVDREYPANSEDPDLEVATPENAAELLAIGGVAFDSAVIVDDAAGDGLQLATVFRGSRSSCGSFAELEFEPLPASGDEAQLVAELWRRGSETGSALLLTGSSASEEAFKDAAPRSAAIHAATHGFFVGTECTGDQANSGLGIDFSTDQGQRAPENPLLLSGLALAGANQRTESPAQGEDGILTAEEIATLDLRATRWVVLSACDTGLGQLAVGEGVLGLRRSFELAGAGTLFTSLWKVDDAAARQWMEALYRARFVSDLGAAQASQMASRSVLQSRREAGLSTHPFYWSPFVASGDWR